MESHWQTHPNKWRLLCLGHFNKFQLNSKLHCYNNQQEQPFKRKTKYWQKLSVLLSLLSTTWKRWIYANGFYNRKRKLQESFFSHSIFSGCGLAKWTLIFPQFQSFAITWNEVDCFKLEIQNPLPRNVCSQDRNAATSSN